MKGPINGRPLIAVLAKPTFSMAPLPGEGATSGEVGRLPWGECTAARRGVRTLAVSILAGRLSELSDTANAGGLRDPFNPWDYFNPEKVNTPHTQTAADILKVVQAFGKNQGNPAYSIDNDRTGLIGGNSWNLGPPDGQQTAADILAAVKQFGHNC